MNGPLTKRQMGFLRRADGDGCSAISATDVKIAQSLEDIGLVREVLFPQARYTHRLTDTGRAALQSKGGK